MKSGAFAGHIVHANIMQSVDSVQLTFAVRIVRQSVLRIVLGIEALSELGTSTMFYVE